MGTSHPNSFNLFLFILADISKPDKSVIDDELHKDHEKITISTTDPRCQFRSG